MSDKTFNPNNRTKKGISPVIATVILVAVAVVIAASLAGFSSSLFGTYSSAGGAVTVKSLVVDASTDIATVTLHNNGNVADKLVSMQALPNVPVTAFTPATTSIAPGADMTTATSVVLGAFSDGQAVTVKMTLESGAVLTQSVVVTP